MGGVHFDTISVLFPVTFHVTYLEELKRQKKHQALFEIPNIHWQNVDFSEMAKTLDESVKQKLCHVLEFDAESIWKKLNGRQMGILFLSVKKNEENDSRQKKLYETVENNAKEHNTVWYIKNHPTNGDYRPIPDMPLISAHIPSEVLTIVGFPIKYAAGDGSSSFFTANAKIIAYIPHKEHYYYKTLIDFNLLKYENIIGYTENKKMEINLTGK